jgi:AraC-like DNA-binding protein
MDHQTLWRFADACQIIAGRIEQAPDASAASIRELLASTPGTDTRTQLIIDGLVARMLERARSRPASATHFKIVEVLTYLDGRFADPSIRLSSAARYAGLSPAHLARLLRTSTGLTFLQHLRRLRVDHAERLLQTTMLSIKEIAVQCGYSASGAFDRDFRRVHRSTPSAWRAQHRVRSHAQ